MSKGKKDQPAEGSIAEIIAAVTETAEAEHDGLDYDNETEADKPSDEAEKELPPIIASYTVTQREGQLPTVEFYNWDKFTLGAIERTMSFISKAWRLERSKAVQAQMSKEALEAANKVEEAPDGEIKEVVNA